MTRAARQTLYMTDAEIAAAIGVALPAWQAAAAVLQKEGFPAPDPLFGGRRYWPAVRAYLDRRAGLAQSSPAPTVDGVENWNGQHSDRRARARA